MERTKSLLAIWFAGYGAAGRCLDILNSIEPGEKDWIFPDDFEMDFAGTSTGAFDPMFGWEAVVDESVMERGEYEPT